MPFFYYVATLAKLLIMMQKIPAKQLCCCYVYTTVKFPAPTLGVLYKNEPCVAVLHLTCGLKYFSGQHTGIQKLRMPFAPAVPTSCGTAAVNGAFLFFSLLSAPITELMGATALALLIVSSL